MNKEQVLNEIVENYQDISDVEFQYKNNEYEDGLPITAKENAIMKALWEQFIDYLYVRDHMLFSHAYVYDNQVYLHFIDVIEADGDIDNPKAYLEVDDVLITADMTPGDLNDIKVNQLKQKGSL